MMPVCTRYRASRRTAAAVTVTLLAIPLMMSASISTGPRGQDGRFLFIDGRVYFTHATGSLSGLDIETGKVTLRLKAKEAGIRLGGDLWSEGDFVVMDDWYRVAVFDSSTWKMLWWAPTYEHVRRIEGRIVSKDQQEDGITCRDLATGDVFWRYSFPSISYVVANTQYVAILSGSGRAEGRDGVPAYDGDRRTLILLATENGRELWRHQADNDTEYENVFLASDSVYVVASPAGTWSSPSYGPRTLVRLNLAGIETDRPATRPWDSPTGWNTIITNLYDGTRRLLDDGRIADAQPGPVPENWSGGAVSLERGGLFPVDGGVISTWWTKDATGAYLRVLKYDGKDTSWHGVLPYALDFRSRGHKGNFLISGERTGKGAVECIDIATGRSLWVYVFPATESYLSWSSPSGMPPGMMSRRRTYRRWWKEHSDLKGFVKLPEDIDPISVEIGAVYEQYPYKAPIILDPEPDDPLSAALRYAAIVWTMALATIALSLGLAIAGLCLAHRSSSQKQYKILALRLLSLLLVPVPVIGYLFWGRVTLLGNAALLIGLVVAVSCSASLFLRRFIPEQAA